jgi:hypothetical protein
VVRIWLCLLGPATIAAQASGSPNDFVATGSMATPRSFHTATLLPDGRVLITGGATDNGVTDSAELYIPSEGTFISAGTMTTARFHHTATLLQDGRVLIAGGSFDTMPAELYDPQTDTFTATGEMHQFGGTATLLDSGQVLITSSAYYPAEVANPELYDPTTGMFTATGAFAGNPIVSSASLLPDGRVLIAAAPTAELYDPATGTFSLTGGMTIPCGSVYGHTATVLMNDPVLVAGGANDCERFADAELYDAGAGAFAATGTMTRVRDWHTATLLPDGTVLIAGGESEDCGPGCFRTTTNTESYAPPTGAFVTTGEMTVGRAGQSATLLNDGTVLIAGGYCYAGVGQFCGRYASAELYMPPVLAPVPARVSVSGDRRRQGAVLRAGTRRWR